VLNLQPELITNDQRCRLIISGAVQGVGFRPFVYRLAKQHHLSGWVQNNTSGVILEVEGNRENIKQFKSQLQQQKPALATIEQIKSVDLPLQQTSASANSADFIIIASTESTDTDLLTAPMPATIPADIAVCEDCLEEMRNPDNRRYRYPFINCSHCGPRYSIMTALPYDRSRTSMSDFTMCAACRAEYRNPLDRRFHAQPIACPDCGPQLSLSDKNNAVFASGDNALIEAAKALIQGNIIALKGLAGFHLLADAGNEKAVQSLRTRKHRPSKPFALMYPSLEQVKGDCKLSPETQKLLRSPAAPIVLIEHNHPAHIAPEVAPGNPYFGVMLPYTPLHHLLLQALNRPLVATSGNRSNEPICIDEKEVHARLEGIADLFLYHNCRIINGCDDSISSIRVGGEMILRRARGYAPLPITIPTKPKQSTSQALLAVGGQLKNTVAVASGRHLILSPHVGDLDSPEASAAHSKAIAMLTDFYREIPTVVAHDLHPDYHSTQMALERFEHTLPVQHHYAHALSCMLDNKLTEPCLAVVWDGSGYGTDGMIWGGEWLNITATGYERLGHLLPFPLPGGDSAVREPRRAAFGLLYSMAENTDQLKLESYLEPYLKTSLKKSLELGFTKQQQQLLAQAIDKGINTPLCTSAGRLFDAVAAIIGLCYHNSFEGEAAMALEYAAIDNNDDGKYAIDIRYDSDKKESIIDWRPMIQQILHEHKQNLGSQNTVSQNMGPGIIAARFHNTLAALIVAFAKQQQHRRVLLTGGCFQNKRLLEKTIAALRAADFEPYWHHQIPPNDGGLAAGQILALLRLLEK